MMRPDKINITSETRSKLSRLKEICDEIKEEPLEVFLNYNRSGLVNKNRELASIISDLQVVFDFHQMSLVLNEWYEVVHPDSALEKYVLANGFIKQEVNKLRDLEDLRILMGYRDNIFSNHASKKEVKAYLAGYGYSLDLVDNILYVADRTLPLDIKG